MLVADFIVVAFTAADLARVLGYLPQIFRIAAYQSGAAAISYATWTMFTLSHLTTVAYALAVAADARLAVIFAANALSSGTIVILTWIKRRQARRAALGAAGVRTKQAPNRRCAMLDPLCRAG